MSRKTIVARTRRGSEYMFSTVDAFYCNPKKAQYIADVLNNQKYRLFGPDNYWKVFDHPEDFTGLDVITRAVCRKNKICFYDIDLI